jgi:hypothetical protein
MKKSVALEDGVSLFRSGVGVSISSGFGDSRTAGAIKANLY